MPHPLDGCLLKLDRASVHLAALGTAIGDVVHNLAAALDYMTWELAVAHTGEGDSRTAFPIFEKRAEYQQYAKRKIKHLHADARAEIERAQPFQVPCTVQHPR